MKRILSAAILLLILAGSAFALSDEEYLRMKNDKSTSFALADQELNRAYEQAKQYMCKSEFEKFKREQREWLAEGRDKAAEKIMRDDGETGRAWAYTEATFIRAQEIYAKTPTESAPISETDFIGTYYNDDDLRLVIYWQDKQSGLMNVSFSIPRLSVELQGCADGKVLEAECDENSKNLAKYEFGIPAEKDVDFKATLTMLNKDKIRVKATPDLDGLFDPTSGIFVRRSH